MGSQTWTIMLRAIFLAFLLCGLATCSPVLKEEFMEERGIVGDLAMGAIQQQIYNTFLAPLGLTTTAAPRPIIDGIGGAIGGILGGDTTTTTASPDMGPLASLFNLIFQGQATTTTTQAPTTTSCGGPLGGGLLC